ncbi:phytoene/squalene synthase family protein [Tomitella biformata]|uniref:phytoene/squalene synthase family protein n=1 Tax=Tomitella biformata TaxID=630403 RepID=UPI0004B8B838|nr:phytoene/squalene synthase family protein [Tomitella biformata]
MASDPPQVDLSGAYEYCRKIAAHHGRTYYLATRLLPADRRPAIHALYAFARAVDDIVDLPGPGTTPAQTARLLDAVEQALRGQLAGTPSAIAASPIDPRVLAALADTAKRHDIDPNCFWAFLHSMRMDLPGTPEHIAHYRTMSQLDEYMYGSAAVIGLQVLPILGARTPEAAVHAEALGKAFQLTNFLRDVGEDLDLGRIYLPLDELAAFDVDEALLAHARATGRPDQRVRLALAHTIAHTRSIYRLAEPGIALLERRARPCVRTAAAVYGQILNEIEEADYQIFDRRITVPNRRRLAITARQLFG